MELSDLKGCLSNPKPALFLFKPTDIGCIIGNGYAGTCAHSNGAINVWEDEEDGGYRAEAMRHFSILDEIYVPELKELQPWLKKWMKAIK